MAVDQAKVRKFLADLVKDGDLLEQYVADPHKVVSDPNADLGPDDRALLLCNNFSQVHRAMTRKEPPSHWVVVWVI